jgi:hypothetical protein
VICMSVFTFGPAIFFGLWQDEVRAVNVEHHCGWVGKIGRWGTEVGESGEEERVSFLHGDYHWVAFGRVGSATKCRVNDEIFEVLTCFLRGTYTLSPAKRTRRRSRWRFGYRA